VFVDASADFVEPLIFTNIKVIIARCSTNVPIKQGWPTGRSRSTNWSPGLSWSIALDFSLNWQDTWKEHFSIKFLFIAFYDIFYLWLYHRPVDRELSRNFLVDPSRRQVGHPRHNLTTCSYFDNLEFDILMQLVFSATLSRLLPLQLGLERFQYISLS